MNSIGYKLLTLFGLCWMQLCTFYYYLSQDGDGSLVDEMGYLHPVKQVDTLLEGFDCLNWTSYESPALRREAAASLSERGVIGRTQECSWYFDHTTGIGFNPPTQEEQRFPLAFSYAITKDTGILELFLSAFFRPTDSYCVHIDAKADDLVHRAVGRVLKCYQETFPNASIFVAQKSVPVFMEKGDSVLESDWACYRELLSRGGDWKMVASLSGDALPMVPLEQFRRHLEQTAEGRSVQAMRLSNSFKYRQTKLYRTEG